MKFLYFYQIYPCYFINPKYYQEGRKEGRTHAERKKERKLNVMKDGQKEEYNEMEGKKKEGQKKEKGEEMSHFSKYFRTAREPFRYTITCL